MLSLKIKWLNYNMTVFVVCIVIAAFIWILIKLSSNYSTELTFPVTYADPPASLILVNDVDSLIQIGLEEQGFVLARLKYFSGRSSFQIDLSKVKIRKFGRSYMGMVSTREWAQDIANDFNIDGEITYIRPDTVIFRFEEIVSKTIDVTPNVKFSLQKQYYAYDSISVEPKQVKVSGLAAIIDTINSLPTESTHFSHLSGTFETEIKLFNPLPGQLKLDPPSVHITIPIEKFTESETTIPISIQNVNDSLRVKIFPNKVRVVFLVALKDFRRVNPDMFSASIDMSEIDDVTDKKIPVQLGAYPSFVRIKKIDPPEVEYLILK
jgi:hypothetical protein